MFTSQLQLQEMEQGRGDGRFDEGPRANSFDGTSATFPVVDDDNWDGDGMFKDGNYEVSKKLRTDETSS